MSVILCEEKKERSYLTAILCANQTCSPLVNAQLSNRLKRFLVRAGKKCLESF